MGPVQFGDNQDVFASLVLVTFEIGHIAEPQRENLLFLGCMENPLEYLFQVRFQVLPVGRIYQDQHLLCRSDGFGQPGAASRQHHHK